MYKLMENMHIVKRFFPEPQINLVIESMLDGSTQGSFYVNDPLQPTVALVWDHQHMFYLGGATDDRAACEKAVAFLKEELLVPATRERLEVGKFYYAPDAWEAILLKELAEFRVGAYPRCFYRHSLEQIPDVQLTDASIVVREIDRSLLQDSTLKNLAPMVGEIQLMWGDSEKFLQTGFGSCAVQGQTILCWCTGEYFSKNLCGIGIETVEEYQGKGVATLTAAHFLQLCKRRRKIPHWDSWQANIGSVRVAEKVGFEKLAEFKIIFARF